MSAAAVALAETATWAQATAVRTVAAGRGWKSATPFLDRFLSNVTLDRDCWLWTKTLTEKGYAPFYISRTVAISAHRWIYTLLVVEIPEGLQLDHLCRRRACVNPWHLEPVTNRENQRRGEQPNAGIAFRTNTCSKGHSLEDAYVYRVARTGRTQRRCRPCQQTAYAEYISRKRQVA